MTKILDGKAAASELRKEVSAGVAEFTAQHGPIRLCSILVGSDEAGYRYSQAQHKRCLQAGIQHEAIQLDERTTQSELHRLIERLNADTSLTGIMLHMPLPDHLDAARAQYRIDPYKDVEGVNPANIGWLFYGEPIIAPCTALAVVELVRRSGLELRGTEACVVGQSRIVGRPISMLLSMEMATVRSCHIATRDLAAHTQAADLVVVAVGKARLIGAEHIRPGSVVIDVGMNYETVTAADGSEQTRTVGDVDFQAVSERTSAITPVPGGVGPLTVMMLLRNTVEAARKQLSRTI